jgi:hypothetical protein
MFYTTPTEVIMSKQNVLGAKQKVLNDKLMLKKRFKTYNPGKNYVDT